MTVIFPYLEYSSFTAEFTVAGISRKVGVRRKSHVRCAYTDAGTNVTAITPFFEQSIFKGTPLWRLLAPVRYSRKLHSQMIIKDNLDGIVCLYTRFATITVTFVTFD